MSRTHWLVAPRRASIAVLALVGTALLAASAHANDPGQRMNSPEPDRHPRLRGMPFLGSDYGPDIRQIGSGRSIFGKPTICDLYGCETIRAPDGTFHTRHRHDR
jgi:hypothetical protein